MAYTRFINATSLTAKVRIAKTSATPLAGTDAAVAILKPCDEAIVKTARGADFEVTDDSGRFMIARFLTAANEAQNVLINDQDMFYQVTSDKPAGVKLHNTLPYEVL